MIDLRSIFFALLLFLQLQVSQPGTILDAVRRGDLEEVKLILSSDPAQLSTTDAVGYKPLHLAAAYARWDILSFLLEQESAVNEPALDRCTPLHCASMYDEPEMIALLLQSGADSSLTKGDIYGEYTPLLRASQRGCCEVVALLLEKGADPAVVTKEGWSALHLAALCGHTDLFDILLAGGVPPGFTDEEGRTYRQCIMVRPACIAPDPGLFHEYTGTYEYGIAIFIKDDHLWLDDHSLNELYPIGPDTFYCACDPWQAVFNRDGDGDVISVELTFLRRSVVVKKVR